MSEQPSLINNDTKVFITNTLKKCHKVKETYYNYMYNIGAFVFLIALFGIILVIKYRGKPTFKRRYFFFIKI